MHKSPDTHINKLFANQVYTFYKQKRFGLKSCKTGYNADYICDLKDLHKRLLELESCDRMLGTGCSLTSIEEKILTL
jgi:hypothetical protein